MLHIAHTTASLNVRNGGPPRTVSALAGGLSQTGARVDLLALEDGPLEETVRPPGTAEVRFVRSGPGAARRFGKAVAASGADLVHDHGLWLPTNHAATAAARRQGTPYAVSTRGMLEPWARRHKWAKKAVAWALYQRRDLAGARFLHATAEQEMEALREVGLRAPIAVIPNGVDVPLAAPRPPRPDGAPRRALFLSRIHPKKGLPMLLDAWARLRPPDWELVVVGPDEGGHRGELEKQADRLGVRRDVRFREAVGDSEKWALYQSADLFVLPTYSENFGVVVAEALAAGVPVLTTTGTPWAELAELECGWWVHPQPRPLTEALQAATSASDAERAAMGARGRARVAAIYGWESIVDRMSAVYEWALGRRPDAPPTLFVN